MYAKQRRLKGNQNQRRVTDWELYRLGHTDSTNLEVLVQNHHVGSIGTGTEQEVDGLGQDWHQESRGLEQN